MYVFNDALDEAIVKPVASAYKSTLPEPVRGWVRNFFANLGDLFIGLNNLLQGKPADTVNDWARFAFNTTIGILGINDVASEMGLEKHNEDFGQTFGRWGASSGAYIVWPLLGPSTVRDTAGTVLDLYFDPVRRHQPSDARAFAAVLRGVGQRADLLDASRILEEAALDKYVFQRDAYLQRRRGLIYDGNPPRDSTSRVRGEPQAEAPSDAPAAAQRLFEEPAAAPAVLPQGPRADAASGPANPEALLAASRTER
jgi:phospholipid-binding lipoprotein MlaA